MTLGEAKKIALKLIDEFTPTAPYTTDEDIANKLNVLFGIAQNEAAAVKRISRSFSVAQNLPMNQIPDSGMVVHDGKDVVFTAPTGRAYHFSVDDSCEVTFEQGGIDIADPVIVISPGGQRTFESFKGLLPGYDPDGGDVSIRFSGNYYYSIKNVALWNVSFSSLDRIPDYERFIEYDLPKDFFQLKRVRPDPAVYSGITLTDTKVILDAYSKGEYTIEYYAFPQMIDDSTPDTYEFEVDQDAQMCLPYGVASDVLKSDVSADYTAFAAKYQGMLANLDPRKTAGMIQINVPKLPY